MSTKKRIKRKKKKKKEKLNLVVKKSVEQTAQNNSVSIPETQKLFMECQRCKVKVAEEQLALEKKKYWMSQTVALFSQGSNESEEECKLAQQLMRKRTLTSLS